MADRLQTVKEVKRAIFKRNILQKAPLHLAFYFHLNGF